ncbi:DUF1173 family protein [Roseateles sp. LYH14W]|uniref:DUF1173 family protein n=1 Tax=Pelomonas parva TaxID=3299032 RepID=A0ABW7FB71_9BURK
MHAAYKLHERRDTIFEISGQRFEPSNPGFAEAIARAHAGRLRPRCLCRSEGAEMYVARLAHGYVVKRMPDTGNRHAADCPSFAPSAEQTGLAPLLGSAIREDPATGITTLRLDFPLFRSRQTGYSTVASSSAHVYGVSASGTKLSMGGLLHYLWEHAGLTRWHPGFEGKRTWAIIRRHLQRAADHVIAGGCSLGARLYVPEPFSLANQDEIRARRWANWSSAAAQEGRHQQLSLLIAEVKEVLPARHGHKAVVKHVPDVAFTLDEPICKAIGQRFSRELGMWTSGPDIRMLMLATFELRPAGVPAICGIHLMPVTRQWLPVDTMNEQQLVEQLVRDGRSFKKLLRYDLRCGEGQPSVALLDRGEPAKLLIA